MPKKAPIMWKTLQPGYVIGTYDMSVEVDDLYIPTSVWKEMKRNGFYGGFFIPDTMKLESLSDSDLAKLGLRRIQ